MYATGKSKRTAAKARLTAQHNPTDTPQHHHQQGAAEQHKKEMLPCCCKIASWTCRPTDAGSATWPVAPRSTRPAHSSYSMSSASEGQHFCCLRSAATVTNSTHRADGKVCSSTRRSTGKWKHESVLLANRHSARKNQCWKSQERTLRAGEQARSDGRHKCEGRKHAPMRATTHPGASRWVLAEGKCLSLHVCPIQQKEMYRCHGKDATGQDAPTTGLKRHHTLADAELSDRSNHIQRCRCSRGDGVSTHQACGCSAQNGPMRLWLPFGWHGKAVPNIVTVKCGL